MGVWKEVKADNGSAYYWNRETNETTWTKPADFDVAAPAPATSSPDDWAVASAANGREYYYNKVTKETTWEMPAVMKQQQSRFAAAPAFVAGSAQGFGTQDYGTHDRRMDLRDDRAHGLPQKPSFDGPRGGGGGGGGGGSWEPRSDHMGFRGAMPVKTDEPEYGTAAQAEEAFFKLLRRNNISPSSNWEDAMRTIIQDREFRAIKDPKDRKMAFEKYCIDTRAQEKEKEKERREKLREEFRKMLATHEEIKLYNRWPTVRKMIEREAVFRAAGSEEERKQMYLDYKLELKKKHEIERDEKRKKAFQGLDEILTALIADPFTQWADAKERITNNERFASDACFRELEDVDILTSFTNHIKALERLATEQEQKNRGLRFRRERQARDGFKALLQELHKQGKLKRNAKWQQVYPTIAADERYKTFVDARRVGRRTPRDIFWEFLENEEHKLRAKRNDAMDVLEELRFEMVLNTSLEEFTALMKSHPKTSDLEDDELDLIYQRLIEKLKQRAEVNKMDAERHQRAAIDSLRSAIKRLEPPVRLDDSFDDVARRLHGNRDFDAANDEVRKSAFDKHIRRLKEREDDRDRDRDRERRDRDRDRNRDRDHRNGSRRREHDRERDRRHRTRTPEVDAYEADRRKAQADRERQYRKASFGLSPPPRDRRDERFERDRRHDRHESMSIYDRERREREMERERNYISRADPRDKGRTLDYGDEDTVVSRPGSIRKRRDSEVSTSSRRENKRTRHARTSTPEAASVPKDEPPALQSGSEEGEIEEI